MKLDIKLCNHDSIQIQMADGHVLTIRTYDEHEFSITTSSEGLCIISSGAENMLNFRTDINRFGRVVGAKGKKNSSSNRGPYKKQPEPDGISGGHDKDDGQAPLSGGAAAPNPHPNGRKGAHKQQAEITA